MNRPIPIWLSLLLLLACSPAILAQQQARPRATAPATTQAPASQAEKKNIQAYIDLIRSNVRQQKAQILGVMMQLKADEAAKFWPIYSAYDEELSKLNQLRSDNIQEYARCYTEMTDAKADELIRRALDYQRQRGELLTKHYERVKEAIGAINAARFVQIENQLLLIIDLQIASSLPIVGQE